MRQVIFKKIRIKNFLSIGDEWVEINYRPGINVVTGINYDKNSRNGIGKSAFLADSISFALYGNPIRDVKKEFIANRYTKKPTKVILSFDIISEGVKDEYVLMRGLEPSRIQLIKNGTDNITKSSIPKTTDFVIKLIGATPEIFANTVVMTLNETIPFMALKKVDKRKFIEGVLKLEIFSNMLLTARQEYNEAKNEYNTEVTRLEELRNTLKVYKSQRLSSETSKQNRINELLQRKENNEKEVNLISTKLEQPSKDAATLTTNIELLRLKEIDCDNQINVLHQILGVHDGGITQIENQIVELLARGDSCNKCKRPFTEEDKFEASNEKEELEKQKLEISQKIIEEKSKLTVLTETKEKCKKGISLFVSKLEEINLKTKENENLLSRIDQLNSWNKQITRDINKIKSEEDQFGKLIEESENREQVLLEKCSEFKDKLSNLDVVKFIVSEEGVKSYIVKKILKVLNTKLLYYLKKFDSNCTLRFNEYFEEQLIDEKGEETTYHNFSAGERKRIDLACLFTFMDIRRLQGDVSTNISIYDELFDTSLEEKGVNMVMDVLKERVDTYGESIYVISHRPTAVKAATGEIIFLEKRGGITTRQTKVPELI